MTKIPQSVPVRAQPLTQKLQKTYIKRFVTRVALGSDGKSLKFVRQTL